MALMQTVVMSFARGLCLGKAELPVDHVHINFPVQAVHKVAAQCIALGFHDVTLKKVRGMSTMWTMLATTPALLPVPAKDNARQCTIPPSHML